MICLGIEGTAEKSGVGIVEDNGKILSVAGRQLIPESGGIHPREASEHHARSIPILIKEACEIANLDLKDIDLISFSRGPGLGPALRTVATASRALALSLNIPIVGVNHCIGHIEIGKLDTGAIDPVTLYVSGGNSQVITYESNKYRVFGETQDIAIGNCLDHFARETGLGHPGGPVIEKLANKGNFVELPYTVKGMDFSFSGLLSAALRLHEKSIAIEDIAYSLQETAFSMITEVTERAISNTKKDELLLCGGVAANKRLREMLAIMAEEHYVKFNIPEMKLCGDNGAMIAWLGLLTNKYFGTQKIEDTTIIQKYRTDEVNVPWVKKSNNKIAIPKELIEKGAESDIYPDKWLNNIAIKKVRISKNYRIPEIDDKIRKKRTKHESKLLSHLKRLGIRTPVLYDIDLKNSAIIMEKIEGKTIDELLNNQNVEKDKLIAIFENIGKTIAVLHDGDVIHGDITTSNIMIDTYNNLVLLDLGLGKYSNILEDKATDLLVFKKSLHGVDEVTSNELFNVVLNSYSTSYENENRSKNTVKDKIIAKLNEIQKRGRYN
ncbi:bifunctional N(6)-L-threonylcarbamoyladenine synthase/serine/threonine protein kinase [Methanobrevibacter filiformis]|uniref:Probable bifunctional tRNA threonylcarbamoyladenosine biosynthesis protein n=1 Tax=Methanobrevibacter filiformis TaxID=55758 RepID=A0A166A2S5_9EURY|nr:bifunctional N(6)-L-threonylcarbamoyladenine synthase/serine/threonine protein kinase [Methanobrevibacter filiformis]KZX11489.1 tRNA N6-adenosine threonylcarbamoyltransferase [Methanobrevibacter filiformis]